MQDYEREIQARVEFIRGMLAGAGAGGIVFGLSGGKDSALVGALCKLACDNTLGIIMPCDPGSAYESDLRDAVALAEQFGIKTAVADLTAAKAALVEQLAAALPGQVSEAALSNIAPRLRMAALYAAAQSRGALVAGTSNRSERFMGYFTKWGDGACDFNPIGDLTVREVYELCDYLKLPEAIRSKVPSAGLYEGQTDESEMGIRYAELDEYLLTGSATEENKRHYLRAHSATAHKRGQPAVFGGPFEK